MNLHSTIASERPVDRAGEGKQSGVVRARQPAARLVDKTAGCSRDDNERRRPATSGHDGASDEPGAVIIARSRLPAAFETAVTLLSGSRKQKKAGHKRRAGFSGSRTCAPGPGVRAAWHRQSPGACSNARPPFRVLQQRRRNGPLPLTTRRGAGPDAAAHRTCTCVAFFYLE